MDRNPTIPLSAFIAVAAIVGGIFWIKGPLESRRPAPEERSHRLPFGTEVVEARLWQDPFSAIEAYIDFAESTGAEQDTIQTRRHTLSRLARDIYDKTRIPGKQVVLMPVMVPGGDYAEDVEQRRRVRKAVIAALGAVDFIPEDDSHIGYVNTTWSGAYMIGEVDQERRLEWDGNDQPGDRGGTSKKVVDPDSRYQQSVRQYDVAGADQDDVAERPEFQELTPITVPYEWFTRERLSDQIDLQGDVLVIWLNESVIGHRIIRMLDQVTEGLAEFDRTSLAAVHVIGPASSTSVLQMMKQGLGSDEKKEALESWLIGRRSFPGFAPTDLLTMADAALLPTLADDYLDDGLPYTLRENPDNRLALETKLQHALAGFTHPLSDNRADQAAGLIARVFGADPALGGIADADTAWAVSVAGFWKGLVLPPYFEGDEVYHAAATDFLANASVYLDDGLDIDDWRSTTIRELALLLSARLEQPRYRSYSQWLLTRYPELDTGELADNATIIADNHQRFFPVVYGLAEQRRDPSDDNATASLLLGMIDVLGTHTEADTIAFRGAHRLETIQSIQMEFETERDSVYIELAELDIDAFLNYLRATNLDLDNLDEGLDATDVDVLLQAALGPEEGRERVYLPEFTPEPYLQFMPGVDGTDSLAAIDWYTKAMYHWRLGLQLSDSLDTTTRIGLHGGLELLMLCDTFFREDGKIGTWDLAEIETIAALSPIAAVAQWLTNEYPHLEDSDEHWRWTVTEQWFDDRSYWCNRRSEWQSEPATGFDYAFHSCRSTASINSLRTELGLTSMADDEFSLVFQALVGAGFERTVATDGALIETLFDELEIRGLGLDDPDVHFALVGEWDSFYGRSLPRAFLTALKGRQPQPDPARPPVRDRLHSYCYLRGLDGILPGASGGGARRAAGTRGGATSSASALMSRPDDASWQFGRNQLDNIQRLALELERKDEELERIDQDLEVIGVVGSDIYDKLLILQALTARFPDAVFFTTDLDAQMLHPTQQSWARNVIVVSSYGLATHSDHQRFTLPFRDSYQSSAYVAVLQALGEMPPRLEIPPRVFEIGRHGLVDLSLHDPTGLHPPFHQIDAWYKSWQGRFCVLAILAAVIFAYLAARHAYSSGHADVWDRPVVSRKQGLIFVSATIVGFLALHATSVELWNRGGYEPLAAFGGVSAWPIQYWRLATIILSVFFLFYARRILTNQEDRITARFGLGEDAWKEYGRTGRKDLGATLDAWKDYRHHGMFHRRSARVLVGLVLFSLLVFGLNLVYGFPPAAFRGYEIRALHGVLLAVSMFSVAAVTIFVLDANFLCWRHVVTLAPRDSGWPERISNAFRARLKVPARRREPVNQVLDLEMIADTTRVVGNLLRWPFLLLLMMILSRNSLHERWGLTPTLLWGYGALFMLALVSSIGLRLQAARARSYVMGQLRDWRCGMDVDEEGTACEFAVKPELAQQAHGEDVVGVRGIDGDGGETATPTLTEEDCKWIDNVSAHVAAMNKGAYAPWYRHAIIQSVLLPLGGLVLITVAEVVMRAGP